MEHCKYPMYQGEFRHIFYVRCLHRNIFLSYVLAIDLRKPNYDVQWNECSHSRNITVYNSVTRASTREIYKSSQWSNHNIYISAKWHAGFCLWRSASKFSSPRKISITCNKYFVRTFFCYSRNFTYFEKSSQRKL